ncbi:hypothetical protein ACJIZ3_011135 [Penstemon smallii]|uniref:Uncharacterized protein n=1 Tax=Penstemon smallii TaxID=265156 RepID=A0ABD3ULF9_9LAMI
MNHEGKACRVYADPAEKRIVLQLSCGASWWTDSIGRVMC